MPTKTRTSVGAAAAFDRVGRMTVADTRLRKRASGAPKRTIDLGASRDHRPRRSAARWRRRAQGCTSGARVARYYDPTTAQFLTRDPIEQLTQQPYQYANGDPLDQTDPLGLCGHWYDVACQVGSAASAVGGVIVDNAGALSTVASGLATVAYAGCILTDGVGCGVGAVLSGASTALSGIAAEQACFGGAGGCASAATSFALSAVATVSGGLANAALKGSLANAENAYARDVLLYRQYAKVGFLSNGIQTLFGAGSSTWWCS